MKTSDPGMYLYNAQFCVECEQIFPLGEVRHGCDCTHFVPISKRIPSKFDRPPVQYVPKGRKTLLQRMEEWIEKTVRKWRAEVSLTS